MPEQNFTTVRQYGGFPRGSVLPKWFIARACNPATVDTDIAHLVERGQLRATTQPVNVTLSVPEPKASGDPTADLVRENNDLRSKLKRAEDSATAHKELAAGHKDRLDAREKSLAAESDKAAYWQKRAEAAEELVESKYKPELAALREELADRAKEVAELKAELDEATAPPVKKHREAVLA